MRTLYMFGFPRTFSSACIDSIRNSVRRVLSIPFGKAFVAYKRSPSAPKGPRGPKGPSARAARVRPRAAPWAPGAPPLGPLVPPTQGVSIRMALAGQGARIQGTYKYGACKWVGGYARSVEEWIPKSMKIHTFLKKAEMLETICFTIENVALGH